MKLARVPELLISRNRRGWRHYALRCARCPTDGRSGTDARELSDRSGRARVCYLKGSRHARRDQLDNGAVTRWREQRSQTRPSRGDQRRTERWRSPACCTTTARVCSSSTWVRLPLFTRRWRHSCCQSRRVSFCYNNSDDSSVQAFYCYNLIIIMPQCGAQKRCLAGQLTRLESVG